MDVMCRCRACNAIIGSVEKTKKRLDPDCLDKNFDEEEDLCNTCLGVAKDTYLLYNEDDPDVRNRDTERHFYTNEDSFDDLYNVKKEIGEWGSIRTEGL